jgi:acyl carrier protein
VAIAWGPIADSGHLAGRPKAREALARRLGARPLPTRAALAGLSAMLDSALPLAAHLEADWCASPARLPILAAPIYSELRAEAGPGPNEEPLAARLAALGPQDAVELLKRVIAAEAAAILRLPEGAVGPQRPLAEIGMDSLMAIELRLALEARLGTEVPLLPLADGASVASLAERLAALSARPRGLEVVTLAARHEAVETASLPEARPQAAE